MANIGIQTADFKAGLPTYLPLREAARRGNFSESMLTQLIRTGKIEAVKLPSGEVLVPANINGQEPETKAQIIAERFSDLQGDPITVTEAAEKYQLNRSNILRWKDRGYITVLKTGYRLELNEAEVAYCAYIYNQRKKQDIVFGTRLFDDEGNPYQLKHPRLAKKRRKQS